MGCETQFCASFVSGVVCVCVCVCCPRTSELMLDECGSGLAQGVAVVGVKVTGEAAAALVAEEVSERLELALERAARLATLQLLHGRGRSEE